MPQWDGLTELSAGKLQITGGRGRQGRAGDRPHGLPGVSSLPTRLAPRPDPEILAASPLLCPSWVTSTPPSRPALPGISPSPRTHLKACWGCRPASHLNQHPLALVCSWRNPCEGSPLGSLPDSPRAAQWASASSPSAPAPHIPARRRGACSCRGVCLADHAHHGLALFCLPQWVFLDHVSNKGAASTSKLSGAGPGGLG